jgi:hypothetical protein
MGNYPPHTQIKLDNFFLSIPSPNTVGMGLDMNNGQPAAGLGSPIKVDASLLFAALLLLCLVAVPPPLVLLLRLVARL